MHLTEKFYDVGQSGKCRICTDAVGRLHAFERLRLRDNTQPAAYVLTGQE